MAGKHTKHDHCEHKNLEYCLHCKVVHCLDCKKEFPEKEIVYVEKKVYADRWTYPMPTVTWEGNQTGDAPFVTVVSDKTVWDKDRFECKIMDDLVSCIHSR